MTPRDGSTMEVTPIELGNTNLMSDTRVWCQGLDREGRGAANEVGRLHHAAEFSAARLR